MTRKTTPHNDHPCWRLWNISMWMSADEGLYRLAVDLCREHGKEKAADILHAEIGDQRTPEGARFSRSAIRYGLRHL